MKKLFTLLGALLLGQAMAVAQNYLHISQGDSAIAVPIAQLDSATVRQTEFYDLSFTPSGLNGKHYAGQVSDIWENNTYTFNITLYEGEGNTMYIYNLDPFFAQYGYVADIGYNILQGELTTAADGKSATLSCPSGQPIGYNNAQFININDSSQPITFTITDNKITCDSGYGVYEDGYYCAFNTFTLILQGATRTPQKAQQVREMTVPLQRPMLKEKSIKLERTTKQEGKATNMQLQPMNSREITQ